MKKYLYFAAAIAVCLPFLSSCSNDDNSLDPNDTSITSGATVSSTDSIKGFYLLCEGGYQSNNATIDYFNYSTGIYSANKFGRANDNAKLGDTGNDIQEYGSKLYIVMNGSNMLRIIDAETCKTIKDISIPNCRFVTFNGGKAYVTSYSSLSTSSTGYSYVARIDTASLAQDATCEVGYQPEQMVTYNGKLYVANSGGYKSTGTYDNRVSVIDLSTFTKVKDITVGINLTRMAISKENEIFISSQTDYPATTASNLFILDPNTEVVTTLNVNASDMSLHGDSLYVYGVDTSYAPNYHIINTKNHTVVSDKIITDGTSITAPYMIKVNPSNNDIFIGDASTYSVPGTLYCFNSKGVKKWSITASGICPGHMVFTKFKL